MTCYHPIKAYRSKQLTANGKRQLVFLEKDAFYGSQPLEIPCGQCIACKLERSRNWAARISNEASLYDDNCFVTLTYAPEHLPSDGSLNVVDHQLFMKRLRKKFGAKIRFFMCGEYGERRGRPHYHYCLLNFDFSDKKLTRYEREFPVYESSELSSLWPFGKHEIGSVTFESAAYVARYITKKITGPCAEAAYTRLDAETGELTQLKPEFTTMSRRPGIGAPWLDQFSSDVYNQDTLVIRGGVQTKPPRFYDKTLEKKDPSLWLKTLSKRESKQPDFFSQRDEYLRKQADNTTERLNVKEIVHRARISSLKRNYEME